MFSKMQWLNNLLYLARATFINVKSNDPLCYPFVVSVYKSGGSSNIIDDLYARVHTPNNVRNMNVRVFNLIRTIDESRSLVQHNSCQ